MKFDNQLRYAVSVIGEYDGKTPLSHWLNHFFREHKQMGSRDRKTLSEMVYGYYRFGHMVFGSVENRMLSALALTGGAPEIVEYFGKPAVEPEPEKIFPWKELLSDGIAFDPFAQSFLMQPDLFLRIRPGKHSPVLEKLNAHKIAYRLFENDCIALSNRTKVADVLVVNKEVVIQDKSSQQTGDFIRELKASTLWDCCAASGGKAIMAFDLLKKPELIVSDLRASILQNLHRRFAEAGINNYSSFVSDLTRPDARVPEKQASLVIADVPCTGSGTWARTPEQLCFFTEERLTHYRTAQEKIMSTVLRYNNNAAPVLYVTCSVFKKENEEMVEYIIQHSSLKLHEMKLIAGYNEKADTMFAALFTA